MRFNWLEKEVKYEPALQKRLPPRPSSKCGKSVRSGAAWTRSRLFNRPCHRNTDTPHHAGSLLRTGHGAQAQRRRSTASVRAFRDACGAIARPKKRRP